MPNPSPTRLCGPARELVAAGGSVGLLPFTVPPLTRQELLHERASLLREQRLLTRALAQNEAALLAHPTA